MQEIKIVQIHGDNLVFRIVALQPDGYHPLYRLLKHTLHHAMGRFRIQLLGQLLRNGRPTAC